MRRVVVNHREDVEFHIVGGHDLRGADDLVEDAPVGAVEPVGVILLLRPIETQPHEEFVLHKKARPVLVDEYAVGLEGV